MSANDRNEKLLAFYSACQNGGYTNMSDSTQSLKAKVIASDLGLNYIKIDKLYAEAQQATETKRRLDNKEGTLLFSGFDSSSKKKPCIRLYKCDDGSYYSIVNNKKIYGKPDISTETARLPREHYTAPSTTYYGVSYNGLTTGSVSHDPGGTSVSMEKTNKGYVVLKTGGEKIIIKAITPSEFLINAFKRHEDFNKHFNGHRLLLDNSNNANYSGSVYNMLEQSYLPETECSKLASLLRRMIDNNLPPSDQEIYDRALKLAESKSSNDIKQAIETFEFISDFADSKQQAENARSKYNEVLQGEKEKAILNREKGRKNAIIVAVAFLVAAILFVVVTTPARNAGKARAQRIQHNLAGMFFSAEYEEHVSYYDAKVSDEYEFSGWEAAHSKRSFEIKDPWNTLHWDSSFSKYQYSVSVSLTGKVTIKLKNYMQLELTVDQNDIPVSISQGQHTFYPEENNYSYFH